MNYRIVLLALGAFAINTGGFIIAGLLPELSEGLNVSLSVAGQLVTVFSLTYAIGSPILTTITGRVERRRLLLGAILLFAAGCFLSAIANGYGVLLLGEIVTAAGAGLFTPTSLFTASALAVPEKRGRALSIVLGGQTVALVLGAPLGTWLALALNWRASFWAVGIVSLLVAVFIRLFLPVVKASDFISLKEKLFVLKSPLILSALLTTLMWGIGIFIVYTYIAEIFNQLGAADQMIGIVIALIGIGSFIGVSVGGYGADRIGSSRTITLTLSLLFISVVALSILMLNPGLIGKLVLGMAMAFLYGISAYGFNPAQQHRIIELSGNAAGIAVSLQASCIYFGSASGALIGGLVIAYGTVNEIGFVAGGSVLAALMIFALNHRLGKAQGYSNKKIKENKKGSLGVNFK